MSVGLGGVGGGFLVGVEGFREAVVGPQTISEEEEVAGVSGGRADEGVEAVDGLEEITTFEVGRGELTPDGGRAALHQGGWSGGEAAAAHDGSAEAEAGEHGGGWFRDLIEGQVVESEVGTGSGEEGEGESDRFAEEAGGGGWEGDGVAAAGVGFGPIA